MQNPNQSSAMEDYFDAAFRTKFLVKIPDREEKYKVVFLKYLIWGKNGHF